MKRNKHSLSNYKLFTCDMGELIPCGLYEVLPGDTIQHNTNALVRCQAMLAPVMHPVDVRIHHFYVPYRLIWSEFEDFITGGPNGTSLPAYPTRNFTAAAGVLPDYLGVPPTGTSVTVSALPFRAYVFIWNEFFRDQDLQNPVAFSTASGVDSTTPANTIQGCGWEKDYFTSARPWEQKGPAVTVPIGTSAPVSVNELGATPGVRTLERLGAGATAAVQVVQAGTAGADFAFTADLSMASGVTVNVLRQALALQRYEEARARFGSRYVEYLRYLGIRSSDGRLNRPEYLGGGHQNLQFSEVLATAQSANTSPNVNVGDLKGHGIGAVKSNRFRRFFEEHGLVMSLFSVRPKSMYSDGLDRMWNRRSKEDFWQKELEHIGQQPVLNKEVYLKHATPDGVFGYQDRYDEYRRGVSTIAGEFRSTLNFWHFARTFASDPALNASFIKCVPSELPFAIPANDVLQVMAKHSVQARRLVSPVGNSFIF